MADPCGEDSHMPVPGLVHRYPDRVLFLVTDRCASYCRYCTRSRVVSGVGEQELHTDFEEAFRYLEEHTEVRDVLLSGGDALLFSDDKLEKILSRLRAIPHIEFLRIGTRVPIFLPQRITPELCAMLQKYHPLWMSVHVNHPRELTVEVKEALERLANHGIPLGNQSVLLAGVNDNVETMKTLVQKLLMCRVRPYYVYQCDLINGSSHLRASVAKGIEIIEGLARPHHRLRRAAIRHRCPRRRRQSADQSRLRPLSRQREDRDPELRRKNLRVSRDRRRRDRPIRARSANITTSICTRNDNVRVIPSRADGEGSRSWSRITRLDGGGSTIRAACVRGSVPCVISRATVRSLAVCAARDDTACYRFASKTISPPITVIAQVVVRISGSGIFMMSFERTVRSASFPTSIDPLSFSSNAA